MKCPKCGLFSSENALKCDCGQPLTGKPSGGSPDQALARGSSTRRRWLAGVVVGAGVLAGTVYGVVRLTTSPSVSISFWPRWDGKASAEEWLSVAKKSRTTLAVDELESEQTKRVGRDRLVVVNQVDKSFSMVIRGRLPMGQFNLKAVAIAKSGDRSKAFIYPDKLQNDDPRAEIRVVRVAALYGPDGSGNPSVFPGTYELIVEKNDVEHATGKVLITGEVTPGEGFAAGTDEPTAGGSAATPAGSPGSASASECARGAVEKGAVLNISQASMKLFAQRCVQQQWSQETVQCLIRKPMPECKCVSATGSPCSFF